MAGKRIYLCLAHMSDTGLERSKNNISRYFNQAFYVYYEVNRVDGKNRYKISPIGYSEAVLTLRNFKSHHPLD